MSYSTVYEQLQQLPDKEARWNYLEEECGFNNSQCREILLGFNNGIFVDRYATHDYDALQMKQIRIGLEEKINVTWYEYSMYDWTQMQAILNGLQYGLSKSDLKLYADPGYSGAQMGVILQGLKDKLDVKWYANPNFSYIQMLTVYVGLAKGLEPEKYAKPSLSSDEMMEIQIQQSRARKAVLEAEKEKPKGLNKPSGRRI